MKNRTAWNKGIPCSEETRRRISLNHADVSGENNPNWGKICSEETRAKIGKANKGKKRTEEEKKRQSLMRKGWNPSELTRKQMSTANKGIRNSMYGKHHTEETKQKLSEALRGERGPNWKGGLTTLYHSIQSSVTYKLWREAVFTRDDFSCQVCSDNRGHNLNAHHIKPFIELIKQYNISSLGQAIRTMELWDIKNGITLCLECHDRAHRKRKPYLTREELYNMKRREG